ncbi:hypothetical protein CKO_01700 [Citrobacter koseri ATCC BAA-895]|uniref:Uncharacterized protein n=1 Tax=Citrobacter koseri (strain ATCC BAA-895 / CDC 4225-83 / SGSC4696) TaxID=290338 RepID=A8AH68_CITK8|nr:hypothetical protein CKO_01700 [Citrobacter koseri ATCC BAA-895]
MITVSIACFSSSLRWSRWFAMAVRNTPAITICFGSCPRSRISRTTLPTTLHISRYSSSSFVRFPIIVSHRQHKQTAYITLTMKTKLK